MIGEAAMIAFSGFGLRIEDSTETYDMFKVYISVPESSFQYNKDGVCMCGEFLAKKFKDYLALLGVKNQKVMFKIRKGEHWTQEMANEEENLMKRLLLGSQA